MDEKFAVALSEKDQKDAIKEISLRIKSIFPKTIKYILLFFTPHYKSAGFFETIDLTLKPQMILGIQAPLLIFDDRVIEKGVIGCCLNKPETILKEIFINNDEPQNIEQSLRIALQKFRHDKQFIFSFLSSQINPAAHLKGLTRTFGNAFNIYGAGFTKKYAEKNYQIFNKTVTEGSLNVVGKGLEITSIKIDGFLPLGKPFMITRVIKDQNVIMEINKKPAIDFYKNYFEEKFDILKNNNLFGLYPLGIKQGKETHLINVIKCLEDGSLLCVGEVKENVYAHLMLLHPQSLFQSLENKLTNLKNDGEGLIFMVNSLPRKKILQEYAQQEIYAINQILKDKFKIIGIYSDYSFFSDKEIRKINIETGHLLITVWKWIWFFQSPCLPF